MKLPNLQITWLDEGEKIWFRGTENTFNRITEEKKIQSKEESADKITGRIHN